VAAVQVRQPAQRAAPVLVIVVIVSVLVTASMRVPAVVVRMAMIIMVRVVILTAMFWMVVPRFGLRIMHMRVSQRGPRRLGMWVRMVVVILPAHWCLSHPRTPLSRQRPH